MKYRVGYFKCIYCKIMYLPVKLDCIIWSCGYDPDVEQAIVYFPSGSLFHIHPVSLIQYDYIYPLCYSHWQNLGS